MVLYCDIYGVTGEDFKTLILNQCKVVILSKVVTKTELKKIILEHNSRYRVWNIPYGAFPLINLNTINRYINELFSSKKIHKKSGKAIFTLNSNGHCSSVKHMKRIKPFYVPESAKIGMMGDCSYM